MYWAATSTQNSTVEMAFLDGTGRVTLFTESWESYTGITIYKDCLFISDKARRSVFYIVLQSLLACDAFRGPIQ